MIKRHLIEKHRIINSIVCPKSVILLKEKLRTITVFDNMTLFGRIIELDIVYAVIQQIVIQSFLNYLQKLSNC